MNLHQHHQSLFFFVSWIFSWNSRHSPLWLFRHDDGWLWYENCVWKCRTGVLAPCTTHTNTRTLTSQSTDAHHDLFAFDFIRGEETCVASLICFSLMWALCSRESETYFNIFFENCSSTARFIKSNFLVLQKKLWPR